MSASETIEKLRRAGQDGLAGALSRLAPAAAAILEAEINAIDLEAVASAFRAAASAPPPVAALLAPADGVTPDARERRRLAQVGEALIAKGKVAVLTVAGGEGTRLGLDMPKGCVAISPVRGASPLTLFAEGIAAASQRAGRRIPWILMTSATTDAATRAHLSTIAAARALLPQTFVQGELPALGRDGQILRAAPTRIARSPDGHGGAVQALVQSGRLAELRAQGVEIIFWHQVDNPFGQRPDPVQLGMHVETGAEFTLKVIDKIDPEEPVGVLARESGCARIVEYSELPPDLRAARDADGHLSYRAGSIAVHTIALSLIERAAAEPLPLHLARKKVKCVDDRDCEITPASPNAYKLERFIFDLMPRAREVAALTVDRESEFGPLKEKTGPFSPDAVRAQLSRWWRSWLAPGLATDDPLLAANLACEISPLYADEPAVLPADAVARARDSVRARGAIYLGTT